MKDDRLGLLRWMVVLGLVLGVVACTVPQPVAPVAQTVAEEPVAAAPAETATPAPTAFPTFTPVPTAVPGVLYVDASQELGPISPLVYGTNYGPWMPLRPETLPLAETAGLTVLRYPGGEWGDQNDLKGYQVDQFVALADKMGAEPMIHVRLPGSTPQQAADLVRYANVEKGYHIRYWAIGNEPSLYQDRTHTAEWDTAYFNAQWRQFAEAMKAVDPGILLFGPETHQIATTAAGDPKDKAGRDWMAEFLRSNGDLVDVVAFHRYPFPDDAEQRPATAEKLRNNPPEWDLIIPRVRAQVREITGRDLPLAVTEINSHWSAAIGGEATPDSLLNAVWWADVLGRLIKHQVFTVTHFDLASGSQGYGLLARFEARPSYYVYPLYAMFGETLLQSSADEPYLSIYAARRDDGALTLMLVNLGDAEVRRPLRIEGFEPGGPAQVWRLDGEHTGEQLDDLALTNGADLTLPSRSVTLVVLPG